MGSEMIKNEKKLSFEKTTLVNNQRKQNSTADLTRQVSKKELCQ